MNLPQELDRIADYCLDTADCYESFTGTDLNNALLIFIRVFTELSYENFRSHKMTMDQQCILIAELGANLRQTVILGTGIDPKDEIEGWSAII